MKYSVLILILLICSCNKEEFKTVTITGTVKNIGTLNPEPGIHIKFSRSNSLDTRDNRGGGIIAETITDSNGNFTISCEISDAFSYTLFVEEDENIFWISKSEWDCNTLTNMYFEEIPSLWEFTTSRKAEIDVDLNYTNPIDTNDVLVVKFIRPDGGVYWFNYISSPGPDPQTDLDLSDYFLGTTRDLFEGQQSLQCTFTKDGLDSVFVVNYNLIAGQTTIVTLDIFN